MRCAGRIAQLEPKRKLGIGIEDFAELVIGPATSGGTRWLNPGYEPSAASAAFATSTSCSILAPPAATAPITSPPISIGKPPGTLVKSPMRTDIDSAFSSGA